jgi:predicted Zn-dependent protease
MIVSEESAIAASKEAYVEVLRPWEKKGKVDNDRALKTRVNDIAGRLIAQAIKMRPETKRWDWSITVIDDPKMVNAWAMAGGKMALYTGLVNKIEPTDDELAQVLGHEIAHALAKHHAEKMSVALASDLGAMTVGVLSDQPSMVSTAGLAASLAVEMPNSRAAESEADHIGMELAAKAGYDPRAAITLWDKMGKGAGSSAPQFLSTHPSSSTRMRELTRLLPEMMPYYRQSGERPVYSLGS